MGASRIKKNRMHKRSREVASRTVKRKREKLVRPVKPYPLAFIESEVIMELSSAQEEMEKKESAVFLNLCNREENESRPKEWIPAARIPFSLVWYFANSRSVTQKVSDRFGANFENRKIILSDESNTLKQANQINIQKNKIPTKRPYTKDSSVMTNVGVTENSMVAPWWLNKGFKSDKNKNIGKSLLIEDNWKPFFLKERNRKEILKVRYIKKLDEKETSQRKQRLKSKEE